MHLIDKAIRISRAKFHCSRLTTIPDIRDYASLIFRGHIVKCTCSLRSREVCLLLVIAACIKCTCKAGISA